MVVGEFRTTLTCRCSYILLTSDGLPESKRILAGDTWLLRLHPFRVSFDCICICRTQWPRGPRRGSTIARLLGLQVRIPPGAWMPVCCECCVLSGRSVGDGSIIRPEDCYRVSECDRGNSWRRPRPTRAVEPWQRERESIFILPVLILRSLLRYTAGA